jgi:hypothetical protein
MLELRRQVGQLLLKKSVHDEWARGEFDALAEVLGVFELAASYANRRGIDKEIVFNQYYLHMYTYWYFAEPHLRSVLEQNPLIFKELVTLLKEFHAFYEYSYTSRELRFPGLPSRQVLKDYLEDETELQDWNGTPGMEGGNGV